jgi:hypothetical protein
MSRILGKTVIIDRVAVPNEPGVFVERCIDYHLRATKGWIKASPVYSRTTGHWSRAAAVMNKASTSLAAAGLVAAGLVSEGA